MGLICRVGRRYVSIHHASSRGQAENTRLPNQNNLNMFSESSWTGPISLLLTRLLSIVRCLYTKRSRFRNERLREYCHEKFCSASDVDLFLYGLTHEQAIDKSQADRTGSQGCSTQCGHCRSYQIRLSLPLPVSILFAISRYCFVGL